jgi:hypothetical protein
MPKTNSFADAIEDHVFLNSAIANVGDGSGLQPAATAGSFWLSLHSSSPGVTGNQATNEVSYTGYARVAVARTSAGWVRSGETTSPAATISFPPCTAGTATATHAGIGSDSSGNGHLFYFGTITPNISIANGVIPQLTTGSTIIES